MSDPIRSIPSKSYHEHLVAPQAKFWDSRTSECGFLTPNITFWIILASKNLGSLKSESIHPLFSTGFGRNEDHSLQTILIAHLDRPKYPSGAYALG